ncbi:hypothetical protein [uncultured Allomuricauda sp.]|uniref:hypothetical protein n=1 Tax=Flagellimonas sp. W118 TaxID=3410791 RepID=UPI002623A109|nr:hypothetical protein [uncultured Allomuricauda sp.]
MNQGAGILMSEGFKVIWYFGCEEVKDYYFLIEEMSPIKKAANRQPFSVIILF